MPLLRWNQVSRSLTCMLFAVSLVSCSVETTIAPTEDAGQGDAPVTEIQHVQAPLSKSSISSISAASRTARKNDPNCADMPTTQPTVLITGTVFFDTKAPATSATVELWHNSGSFGAVTADSARLDAARVGPTGAYALRGPDLENLRVHVKNAPHAVAEIYGHDPAATGPVLRRVTEDFILPAPHMIIGRVLTHDDHPVSGALVSLQSEDVIADGWFYGNQQTTTTATGDFTLHGVAAGPGTIGAVAPSASAVTQPLSAPTTEPIILRLTTGSAVLSGHVLQFPGNQLLTAGSVTAGPTEKTADLNLGVNTKTAIQPDGTFRMENLPPGKIRLSVSSADGAGLYPAPGEPAVNYELEIAGNETTAATLLVFPGYTIAGTVFDKDTSEPLSGAKVKIGSGNDNAGESDAAGQFQITRVEPADKLKLSALLPGYVIWSEIQREIGQSITIAAPKDRATINADVLMQKTVTITGRVENPLGFAIPAAEVEWRTLRSGNKSTVSGPAGEFRMEVTPFSEGYLEAQAKGYGFNRTTETIKVVAEDISHIIITLHNEAIVEGRVITEQGEPISGAKLVTSDQVRYGTSSMIKNRDLALSDGSGQFRIDSLEPGGLQLVASAETYKPGKINVSLQAGETKSGIEIKLVIGLTITGRVVGADDGELPATITVSSFSSSLSGFGRPAVPTDKDGNFELTGLEAEEYSISAATQRYKRRASVKAKAGAKDVIIRMDENAVMKGTVVDAASRDLIEKFSVDGASTDGEGPGKFRLEMEPGHSTFPTISAEGYVTRTFEVSAPKTAVEFEQTFEMGYGSSVQGRVMDGGTNQPVPDVPIATFGSAFFNTGDTGNTVTGPDGTFVIAKLPAGKTRVSVMAAPPHVKADREVELKDGEVHDLGDITLGGAGSISGKVVRLPDNQPVLKAFVSLNGPMGIGQGHKLKITDVDGLFRFENLAPGEYHIGLNSQNHIIHLKNDEAAELTISLGTVIIRGDITRNGQKIKSDIKITNPETGQNYTAWYTSTNMSQDDPLPYRLSDIPPGAYQATISTRPNDDATSSITHTEQITVPDQAEFQKDFVLP